MAGAGETARLEMFRDLLSDAHRALDLQFGFELWDGSTIPADLPSYAMRLVIRRESVIAALLRRPNLDTALNAYVRGCSISRTAPSSISPPSARRRPAGA